MLEKKPKQNKNIKISEELKIIFWEMAELIYGEDKMAMECALEDAEIEGDLAITFDDFSEFESRLPKIEEACWARGLTIKKEGMCYIIKR